MELASYFKDFLASIRLTDDQTKDLITGHQTLRTRLNDFPDITPIVVSTFLQGSYKRGTAVRPKGGNRSDVDIVVVTRLASSEYSPENALKLFIPFLEKHYKGKYKLQGRSIGIELSYVDLDLVITAAPSKEEVGILESDSVTTDNTLEQAPDWRLNKSWVTLEERHFYSSTLKMSRAANEPEWQLSPLLIPDRDAECWKETHPLEQILWTRTKNKNCNGHYINVVKCIKWWRRVNHTTPKYPKGYPIEHLVGQNCPDGISSVAAGITHTLENIVQNYKINIDNGSVPYLADHGVPNHDVFHRITADDFAAFYQQVCDAAIIARNALNIENASESRAEWFKLFGNKFPEVTSGNNKGDGGRQGGYTPREDVTNIGGTRFGS